MCLSGIWLSKVTNFLKFSNLNNSPRAICLSAPSSCHCIPSDLTRKWFVKGSCRCTQHRLCADCCVWQHRVIGTRRQGEKVMWIQGDAVTQIRPRSWEELVSLLNSGLLQVLTMPINVQVSKLLQLYFFLFVFSSLIEVYINICIINLRCISVVRNLVSRWVVFTVSLLDVATAGGQTAVLTEKLPFQRDN